jgi:hypothetical protein
MLGTGFERQLVSCSMFYVARVKQWIDNKRNIEQHNDVCDHHACTLRSDICWKDPK